MAISAADFLSAFQQLLPRGRAWPREPDAFQTRALATLMPVYERLAGRDENLLVDAFPATTVELLPEWETTLGLPDPCAGESPTVQQRQAQVLARFTSAGGQSAQFFIDYAAKLGFPITITNCAPARASQTRVGQPCNSEDWAFVWYVDAPQTTITYARASLTRAGEPLAVFGNAVLACELNRLAPAHTVVIIRYDLVLNAIWDEFVWDDGRLWG